MQDMVPAGSAAERGRDSTATCLPTSACRTDGTRPDVTGIAPTALWCWGPPGYTPTTHDRGGSIAHARYPASDT